MKYDIARQPLVPAFLTLVALAAAYAWIFARCGAAPVAAPVAGSAIGSPEAWIAALAAAHPSPARAAAVAAFVVAALCTGRTTVRYNLYGVATCVAIPLAGLFAVGLMPAAGALRAAVAVLLVAYSTKNFARSFRNGYAFDALLRGGGYLGLTVAVLPATLPLVLLLPFAVVLFRRTLREAAVALFGVLLPLSLLAYVDWGAGGRFPALFERFVALFASDGWLGLWRQLPVETLVFSAALLLSDLAAIGVLLRNLYGLGTQARFILFYNISVLVLLLAACCGPGASPYLLAAAAVPSAVLVPTLLVRLRPLLAAALYLVLFVLVAVKYVLQYSI